MTLGKQMRKIRKSRDMTQKEVGELIGFSEKCAKSVICDYENDKRLMRLVPFIKFIVALRLSYIEKLELVDSAIESVTKKSQP